MAYAYGMRFDDDSNAITVIDEDNQTAVTTGYINGEYVEFDGGENPNYMQTITGTAADPWGGIAKDLHTAIANGGASATIAFSMGQQTLQVPLSNNVGTAGFIIRYGNYYPANGDIFEFYATWFFDDDTSDVIRLYDAYVIEGSNGSYTHTDYKNMASMIPTTLTIIWHPLPEE